MLKRPVFPLPTVPPSRSVARPILEGSQPETVSATLGVRAQLLAAEHWSLLATRSTAQSEVLSRIATFLMLVSSSIVGLALIGQVTRFDKRFIAFALVLLGMLAVIGTLTQIRVGNASLEDLACVIGMNRLRAAYVELDQHIERYLVTSAHDDDKSVWQTYNPLMGPHQTRNVLASGATFITFVTSGLAAAFAALVAVALNAPVAITGVVAAACGLAFLTGAMLLAWRRYSGIRRSILFPSPDADSKTSLGNVRGR